MKMDQQFDEDLIAMKPFLLNLPYKTERQRCAIWIKKLCEPTITSLERKNRNLYTKLLLHMLKRGTIDGPFTKRPGSGPLPSLPSYMALFFDDASSNLLSSREGRGASGFNHNLKNTSTPDWAKEELPIDLSDVFPAGDGSLPFEDSYTPTPRISNLHQITEDNLPTGNTSNTFNFQQSRLTKNVPSHREEQSLMLQHDKELQMKAKILEAEFHEEKLNLQHKHDLALQKVLNRKNAEIEELKRHYTVKDKDYEDIKHKLERKVQSLQRDVLVERESKEKQMESLNKLLEENTESVRGEYEEKVHTLMGELEKEKYELQKSHTKNIQDLLDDTNKRLEAMEDEYSAQSQTTKIMINELEDHVSQLTAEVATAGDVKQQLLIEKQQVEQENKKFLLKIEEMQSRYDEVLQELSSSRMELNGKCSQHALDLETMKAKQKNKTSLVNETIRELECQLHTMKKSMQENEEKMHRVLKEKESAHQQNVMRLQHAHEKLAHGLQREWEEEKADHYRAMKTLEQALQEKEKQIAQLTVTQKHCAVEAEKAIENYKAEASDAQQKVYADMREQLLKLEQDLEVSKRCRLQQEDEFEKRLKLLNGRHIDELNELRLKCESDKEKLLQTFSTDREKLLDDCEERVKVAETQLRDTLTQQQQVSEERKLQHINVVSNMEEKIRTLQEEVQNSNSLRRQQLVELGLLREEERQKASRDHEIVVAKLQVDLDKQRMELHKQHAAELEQHTLKMKISIERLGEDYREQLERVQERLMDAMNKEAALVGEMERRKQEEEKLESRAAMLEEEYNALKRRNNSLLVSSQANLEKSREDCRSKERLLHKLEFELKNELSQVKLECEERMKGMIPRELKSDLEETIDSLRSQVKYLQQRIDILQDEANFTRSRSLQLSPGGL